jgi:hypothetical protein
MKRGAGRGRVYGFFLLAACFAVCAASGCPTPIGSIGGVLADLFWVEPKLIDYELNDEFQRDEDLQVFASYRGEKRSVSPDEVKIGIADLPDESEQPYKLVYIPEGGKYKLESEGKKLVVVEYGSMFASYSIEVRKPEKVDGPTIIIDWQDDK